MDSVANLTHRSMVYNAAFHAPHYLPVDFHKRSRAVVREKPKRGLALLAVGIFLLCTTLSLELLVPVLRLFGVRTLSFPKGASNSSKLLPFTFTFSIAITFLKRSLCFFCFTVYNFLASEKIK